MNKFFKKYIGIVIVWLILIIAAIMTMPNSSRLVADQGQAKLPVSVQSQVANTIKNHWGPKVSHTRQVFVVFNSGSKKKLNDAQTTRITSTLSNLDNKQKGLDIASIVKPSDATGLANQFISKDGTTQLAELTVGKRDPVRKMNTNLKQATRTAGVKTYVTSSDVLKSDSQQATKAGIWKIEVIAAVVIFLILVLIFRSLWIPVISLLSTAVSYLIALSVVFNLARHFNFPISSDTQVFMLVILLGLGTDFSIMLFNEFKQQLRRGSDQLEATLLARKNAGKTILVASLTLIVGFGLLGLASFNVYRSLAGVAIGIFVLLLVLATFTPFFMFVLAERLFWPSRNLEAHNYSRSWGFLSTQSVAHPIIALIIAGVVAIPFVLASQGRLNYNPASELNSDSPAKVGYKVIQNHFPNGQGTPVTIYIKADHKLQNDKDLMQVDRVTKQLQEQKGIHSVTSATQPHGIPLGQMYVNQQIEMLNTAFGNTEKGVKGVSKKLKKASISTSSLGQINSQSRAISQMMTSIQQQFNNNGIFETPEQMVNQMQKQLRDTHRRRLTQVQQNIILVALRRTMNDQEQQSQMNSALSSIGLKTNAINSSTTSFRNELNSVQSQFRSYGNQLNNFGVSIGLSNAFLKDVGQSPSTKIFYISKAILKSGIYKQTFAEYMSKDQKSTKLEVVLDGNPSSPAAMRTVRGLQNQVQYDLNGTSLKNAKVAVGGDTSTMADTQQTAKASFKKIAIIVGVAMTLILMLVAGSILQPVYMMGALGVTYLMSLGFTKWFSGQFLDQKFLTWNMPFLTYMMLLTLGVDYSIYLFMKYRQTNPDSKSSTRMINASILIGTVVIFAVIVIGVTFASLIPSGVLTLIQVAIAMIFGLIIFGVVVPVIIPGLMKLTYEGFDFKWRNLKHKKRQK